MSRQRRLTAKHGGLLIVDLQEKLVDAMSEGPQVVRKRQAFDRGGAIR